MLSCWSTLLVIILSLVATHGESYSICPFLGNCAVTPATAQALHHLSIAPSSYVTYNVVLALLQSLIFLSVGGFIFWRKSNEPIALVASFFLVSIGLSPFFQATSTFPLEVIFLNIYVLCIYISVGLLPDDLSRWPFCSAVELALAGALDAEDHLLFYPRTIHDHVVASCTQCNLRDGELRRDHCFNDLSLHTRLESLATPAGKVAPLWLRWNVCADHPV